MQRIFLLAGLALSGCATASSLDGQAPRLAYDSAKSPAQLEECIALALSSAGTPNTIRGEQRRIMSYEDGGVVSWTVTISDGPPSRVEMRWSGPIMAAKWKNRVQSCA